MKNRVLWIVAVIMLIVCGFGGVAFQRMMAARAEGKDTLDKTAKVTRGDLEVRVVETGTIDAVKAVEVKSRVSGRISQLLVEEGDRVEKDQLIAVIDPKETKLQVERDSASLAGAQSAVERSAIDIAQRRVTAAEDLKQAKARVAQLEAEVGVQPTLTSQAIESAQTAVNTAVQAREQLVKTTQPLERTNAQTELTEANSGLQNAQAELTRQQELLKQGFVAERAVEVARLALDQAQSRLARAQDRVNRLATQQQIELQQADERVRQAETDLTRAKANRIQDVVKRKDYETAVAAMKKAEAALMDVDALQKSRQQQMANVRQLQSVVGESQRQLGETEIRAPIAGVVTKKMVQEGELVASISGFSAGTPIVRIEDRGQMMVKLDINEIDTARLSVGMPAKVEIDALPKLPLEGNVHKIAPASKTAGTATQGSAETVVKYEVEIWLTSTSPEIRSGMSAKCTIIPEQRKGVLQLPVEFVGTDSKGRFVEFPLSKAEQEKKDAKPKRVYVEVGLSTGSRIEILSGVKEGEVVARPKYTGPERKGMMQMGPDDGGGDSENKGEDTGS